MSPRLVVVALISSCSVFPDAPLDRNDASAVGGGGMDASVAGSAGALGGSAGGPGGGGSGGSAATDGGPVGGAGGSGGAAPTCESVCSQLLSSGCSDASEGHMDCLSECEWTEGFDCKPSLDALLGCLTTATVYCSSGYPEFDGCGPEFPALYECISHTPKAIACQAEICLTSDNAFCCVNEDNEPPHCHTPGDCYTSANEIHCDSADDCDAGQQCCAEFALGVLADSACQDACPAGQVAMCTGNKPCPAGSNCVQSADFEFYSICQ